MEWVETTGRTVDEAKDLALDRLGVDEADAEFEVVEEPRPGLFGRMRGEARVRARVRSTQPRPKVERRERRRRSSKSEAEPAASAPRASRNGEDDMDDQDEVAQDEVAQDAVAQDAAGGAAAAVATTRSGNGRDTGQAAAEFLEGLAGTLGAPGTTEIVPVGDGDVEVRLFGDDLGLLIGPRGQTLQAVQDLTRIAVQRHDEDRHGRLRIDIAGYRERRREALGRFTEQVVAQVVASGEPRALEPMSSADRKVVHDVAGGLGGVSTRSEGEDPFRRVVIVPSED